MSTLEIIAYAGIVSVLPIVVVAFIVFALLAIANDANKIIIQNANDPQGRANRFEPLLQTIASSSYALESFRAKFFGSCLDIFTLYVAKVTITLLTIPFWMFVSKMLLSIPGLSIVEPIINFIWILVVIFATWVIQKIYGIKISGEENSALQILAAIYVFIVYLVIFKYEDSNTYAYYLLTYLTMVIGRFVFFDTNQATLKTALNDIRGALKYWWVAVILGIETLILFFCINKTSNISHFDFYTVLLIVHLDILFGLHSIKYSKTAILKIFQQ